VDVGVDRVEGVWAIGRKVEEMRVEEAIGKKVEEKRNRGSTRERNLGSKGKEEKERERWREGGAGEREGGVKIKRMRASTCETQWE